MNIGTRAAIMGIAIFQKLRRTKRRIEDDKRGRRKREIQRERQTNNEFSSALECRSVGKILGSGI
jgi:hypothetical protein